MKNANNFFGNSVGSENLYSHSFTHLIYTDGVKDLAATCGAYWLLDLIFSHQIHDAVKKEPFQVWDLKRVLENEFSIIATDGNHNKVTSQDIPFSDFSYDIATLWLVDGCLMLPCEY